LDQGPREKGGTRPESNVTKKEGHGSCPYAAKSASVLRKRADAPSKIKKADSAEREGGNVCDAQKRGRGY